MIEMSSDFFIYLTGKHFEWKLPLSKWLVLGISRGEEIRLLEHTQFNNIHAWFDVGSKNCGSR